MPSFARALRPLLPFLLLSSLLPSAPAPAAAASAGSWLSRLSARSRPLEDELAELRQRVLSLFDHAYGGYMRHAFPADELRPLSGSGADTLGSLGDHLNMQHPEYRGVALTLIDVLPALALLGNTSAFREGVGLVEGAADFDQDVRVNVFEATIRAMGGLLSAHALASDPRGPAYLPSYTGALLPLARDLGDRLLRAFDASPTCIPYPWVNLKKGVLQNETTHTNLAAAGSLLLEFGVLSRLTGDCRYEDAARTALDCLFGMRTEAGLFGKNLDMVDLGWLDESGGIGAGADSFYETLLKAHVALGGAGGGLWDMFQEAYSSALRAYRSGSSGWYHDAHITLGVPLYLQFNALMAFWPGMQVLAGDVHMAATSFDRFFALWEKYSMMPENYHWKSQSIHPTDNGYHLRPELIESAYYLYQATGNQKYLSAGRRMLDDLEACCWTPYGFASVGSVDAKDTYDAMPSYFLSETLPYLYLLFDPNNPFGERAGGYVLSTEAHPFPIAYLADLPDCRAAPREESVSSSSRNSTSTSADARPAAASVEPKAAPRPPPPPPASPPSGPVVRQARDRTAKHSGVSPSPSPASLEGSCGDPAGLDEEEFGSGEAARDLGQDSELSARTSGEVAGRCSASRPPSEPEPVSVPQQQQRPGQGGDPPASAAAGVAGPDAGAAATVAAVPGGQPTALFIPDIHLEVELSVNLLGPERHQKLWSETIAKQAVDSLSAAAVEGADPSAPSPAGGAYRATRRPKRSGQANQASQGKGSELMRGLAIAPGSLVAREDGALVSRIVVRLDPKTLREGLGWGNLTDKPLLPLPDDPSVAAGLNAPVSVHYPLSDGRTANFQVEGLRRLMFEVGEPAVGEHLGQQVRSVLQSVEPFLRHLEGMAQPGSGGGAGAVPGGAAKGGGGGGACGGGADADAGGSGSAADDMEMEGAGAGGQNSDGELSMDREGIQEEGSPGAAAAGRRAGGSGSPSNSSDTPRAVSKRASFLAQRKCLALDPPSGPYPPPGSLCHVADLHSTHRCKAHGDCGTSAVNCRRRRCSLFGFCVDS